LVLIGGKELTPSKTRRQMPSQAMKQLSEALLCSSCAPDEPSEGKSIVL
jgi:hypothetical protein